MTAKAKTKRKATHAQLAARKRFAAAAKAGTLKKGTKLKANPVREAKKPGARTRAVSRKPATSLYTAGKKTTPKFYLMARVKNGDGYDFLYFNGRDRFLPTKTGAQRYAKRDDALAVGRGLLQSLPAKVLDLRAERA